jgi:TrpR family trp operon transcriptional repressor
MQKKKESQAHEDEGWQGLLNLCQQVKSPKELDALFSLFFTHEERAALSARYLIIKALLEGRLSQRKIASTYKVSIAQITRGSNALKVVDQKTLKFLQDFFRG